MKSFVRLLIFVLVVSGPAQSWAAPMLCQSGMDSSFAAAGHAHDAEHEHHADMEHGSSMHDSLPDHDHASSDCESNCDCGHCVLTIVLSDTELASAASYREERAAMCAGHLALYFDNIFRPPISS